MFFHAPAPLSDRYSGRFDTAGSFGSMMNLAYRLRLPAPDCVGQRNVADLERREDRSDFRRGANPPVAVVLLNSS